jgi:hypothetical protein
MDARFDGGCRGEEALDGAAQYQSIHRFSVRTRSALRIEPVAPGERSSRLLKKSLRARREVVRREIFGR